MTMKRTPLHDAHKAAGAKTGPFAGYDMPLYYRDGVIAEHEWTRSQAGLFDVSHMGQLLLEGPGAMAFLSRLTPSDFTNAPDGRAKYTVLTNEAGGIVDDLIVTRMNERKFFAVINSGCKDKDLKWIGELLPDDVTLTRMNDHALLALQGPKAEQVLRDSLGVDASAQPYMWLESARCDGMELLVSRLGYTGEDGFELSMRSEDAPEIWARLTGDENVRPIGLAARDSLRLEMGYPLYGHDIDDKTSPVEAGLGWVIAPDNKGFIGAETVLRHKEQGGSRRRIGVRLTGQGVAREGAEIRRADGTVIGQLSSGGFSPTLKASIGMGYVDAPDLTDGDAILVTVRGRNIEAVIAPLPFVKAKTRSMKKATVEAQSVQAK